jgi:hypothetical protein
VAQSSVTFVAGAPPEKTAVFNRPKKNERKKKKEEKMINNFIVQNYSIIKQSHYITTISRRLPPS